MSTRPAPEYALSFSSDAVHLMERSTATSAAAAARWRERASAPFDAPDFRSEMARLRKLVANGPDARVALIIPDDQILYTSLPMAESDVATGLGQALDGLTPYPVAELAWDWRQAGERDVRVAAVARQTLREAEDFARRHGFDADGFLADPAEGLFPETPRFADARAATPAAAAVIDTDLPGEVAAEAVAVEEPAEEPAAAVAPTSGAAAGAEFGAADRVADAAEASEAASEAVAPEMKVPTAEASGAGQPTHIAPTGQGDAGKTADATADREDADGGNAASLATPAADIPEADTAEPLASDAAETRATGAGTAPASGPAAAPADEAAGGPPATTAPASDLPAPAAPIATLATAVATTAAAEPARSGKSVTAFLPDDLPPAEPHKTVPVPAAPPLQLTDASDRPAPPRPPAPLSDRAKAVLERAAAARSERAAELGR
ncbi:hypothetical protein [Paracoccus sphaerophysae]|uniref:hypothetical protein n=1 Tax=Paracoccus sphaerophysae TaxID=690417 RepID=UPI00235A0748|nr:hypothetical protein [Paracoccus sphaerophysae]